MRLPTSIGPIIFGLMLAIGINFSIPYLAFSAAHSFGSSGDSILPGCNGNSLFHILSTALDFLALGGDGEQQVIIIQQFQSAGVTEPRESATNRNYVSPRWMDGGYGVQILEPGYWTDPK